MKFPQQRLWRIYLDAWLELQTAFYASLMMSPERAAEVQAAYPPTEVRPVLAFFGGDRIQRHGRKVRRDTKLRGPT